MVSVRSTFKPFVEHLENRNCPAVLTVNAAQLATLHDAAGFDGEAGVQAAAATLPAEMANAVVVLQLPQELNAFATGYGNAVLTFESGDLTLVHWGQGREDAEALAGAMGVAFLEPVLADAVPTLPVSQSLVDALLVMQLGDALTTEVLASGLQADPATLAVAAPDGILTLSLAVPLASGGWQVQTLTSAAPSSPDYTGWWTLAGSETAPNLTHSLGLWELRIA